MIIYIHRKCINNAANFKTESISAPSSNLRHKNCETNKNKDEKTSFTN